MKTHKVAKTGDLKDREMKRVKAGDTEILLCRIDGEYSAVGSFCPHYGAPLDTGILSGDRIVCPWHHACFNAKTGDLEEPPSRDALSTFDVKEEGEDVVISVPEQAEGQRVPDMVTHAPQSEPRHFAIVGAGAAANAAAQALRETDFEGRISMITFEGRGPYDRPNLSKDYLQGKAQDEWMPLRPPEFYEQYGIELALNRRVTSLVVSSKTATFDNKQTEQYDAVLIATGGQAQRLDLPGATLKNIYTLRSYDDCDRIIAACKDEPKVVVIGASFIGTETAISLAERDLDVSVVTPGSVPLERAFGKEIGQLFQKAHEKKGVRFHFDSRVAKFDGNGAVENVMLENGNSVKADLVLVGVGVKPATDFIQGIDLHSDGSINVDEHFCAEDGVYAAGDIARFPDWRTGDRIRIEHWRTAEQQGRIAGQNMAGKSVPFRSVPFFWTTQAGLHFRYVGHAADWDEIMIHGDILSRDFVAFYVKDNTVLAAAGNGRDQEMAAIEELMRLKKMPKPDELHTGSVKLLDLL